MMLVDIKRINNGLTPSYGRDGDACLDCYSNENVTIASGDRYLVHLGFALQLPKGYEAVIRPRSGMSKKKIDVCIGTIDSNYIGEVMANVVNNSAEPYEIKQGDRVCQIAIRKTEDIVWSIKEELEPTNRGSDGFGSSGV